MAAPTQPEVSAAFFNPQSRAPSADYLSRLQNYLLQHEHGQNLLKHVAGLSSVWPVWAAARDQVRDLPNAQQYLAILVDWANGGPSAPVSEARTGIIALPLLLILQVGQYFAYLEIHGLSHAQFIAQVRHAGGIQGCCGGEPPALSLALARDEAQIIENAAVFLRILVGVGSYIEALDDWSSSEPTIIAVRLKCEAQGEELMRLFPGVSLSANISKITEADIYRSIYRPSPNLDLLVLWGAPLQLLVFTNTLLNKVCRQTKWMLPGKPTILKIPYSFQSF